MSDRPAASKLRLAGLTLGFLLAIALLYLVTYPPMRQVALKRLDTNNDPRWLVIYGRPYHWLYTHTPLSPPLEKYYLWWRKVGD